MKILLVTSHKSAKAMPGMWVSKGGEMMVDRDVKDAAEIHPDDVNQVARRYIYKAATTGPDYAQLIAIVFNGPDVVRYIA